FHALCYNFTWLALPRPELVALLLHATVGLLASLGLQAALRKIGTDREGGNGQAAGSWVNTVFLQPLQDSALVTSCLAVPLLLAVSHGLMRALALDLGWLAVLWLIIAWTRRWPVWFAAFQVALSGAVVYGVTAW